MNETEMAELLRRSTGDLAPDLPGLVAGGLRRGRVRQRRQRVGAVLAASAVVALVGFGSAHLLGDGGGTSRGVSPAGDPSTTVPTVSPSATTSDEPLERAELAVTTEQVPTTFAGLEPGRVSGPSPKSGPDAAPVVDFTWRGFGIRVGLTPDDYVDDHAVVDPARRCAEQAGPAQCRPGADATVVTTSSFVNPAADGGTSVRSVTVFRPDGWDVLVMVYNGPGKDGPVTAAEPPFDLEELERIASSDVWFA
ncbi:hypothetical protein [Nocardioides mangrovi]|uniref:Uncharacterized protein n=1 Tax=Nocardioides mangrovi TaxID=2874580 RepID=A0ABS7UD08_9ACTN|nr:hypothetical protein [Nocardioides mangrovi]MBZ5738772.1 hypothetical protein [Nocardioides mangrovi]